jgi:hypothetical protein
MYIKISSKSGNVNRLALEKLGLSTKREDPATIGQFGSGIKYAPIAAIRLGLDFIFAGQDSISDYQLRYSVFDEDGIKSICYDYGAYTKPSSFTVDAGRLSWESHWQIYREVISNAKDAGIWTREIVEEIVNEDGYFSVFITASPEMMQVYNKHDHYFNDSMIPVSVDKASDIKMYYQDSDSLRIYCKTVLVYNETVNKIPSYFNYEIPTAHLNEERKLASFWSTQYEIGKAIQQISEPNVVRSIYKDILGPNPKDTTSFEFWNMPASAYLGYPEPSRVWGLVFNEMYGDNAVLVDSQSVLNPSLLGKVKQSGHIPVICLANGLYKLLDSTDMVKTINDISGEDIKYDIDSDIEKYPKLAEAYRIVTQYEPQILLMAKSIGVVDFNSTEILGCTINMTKPKEERQILISKSHIMSGNIVDIIATIVHEFDHYDTGIGDGDKEFRARADHRIGKLVAKSFSNPNIEAKKGTKSLSVRVKDLPYFGNIAFAIEKSKLMSGYLVSIGDRNFIVKGGNMNDNLSGVLQTEKDGQSLSIVDAFVQEIDSENVEIREI